MQTTAPAQTDSDQMTAVCSAANMRMCTFHADAHRIAPGSWLGLSLLFIKHASEIKWSGACGVKTWKAKHTTHTHTHRCLCDI